MIGLVAVLVVVLGAVAVFSFRRTGNDEMHSVEGYRQALDTLREVGSHGSASVRIIGRDAEGDGGAGAGGSLTSGDTPVATTPADAGLDRTGDLEGAGSEGAVPVFGERDAAGAAAGRSAAKESRQARRAISAMNHRPRRIAGPLLAGLVAAGAVAALVIVFRSHRSTTPDHHTTAETVATHRPMTDRTQHRPPLPQHHPATHTPSSYQPVSATPGAATYAPPATSYSFTVSATSAACWVQITQGQSATPVYSQTLGEGQSEAVTLTGPATVLLGSPTSVSMRLDSEPVVMPAGFLTPFTLTLQPTPAGA